MGLTCIPCMRLPCLLTSLAACLMACAGPEKPNILFLLSDDQAWGDYGFMGHPHIETPALDKLAKQSLTFTRGYSPVPLCRPSLATIVTGLYPHQHQITGNDPVWGRAQADKAARHKLRGELNAELVQTFNQSPNLMRSLKDAGYLTLQTGKWWEGNPVTDSGFTHGMTHGDPTRGGRHGDVGLSIGRDGQQPIYDFIKEAGDQPWFVWYGVFLPHTPHNPPKELLDKYLKLAPTPAIARYWANCEWHDRAIGELIAHLEQIGQLDNTVILYTTDNGWIQEPDAPQRYADRSKQTIYEGGVRTPIMVSWKGRIQPTMNHEHLATNLDIWPTIAGLTGCELPDNLTGVDLTKPAEVAARDTIYGEDFAHDMTDRDNPLQDLEARFLIEKQWKLIVPRADRPAELYDLSKDPWETRNVAAEQPNLVERLTLKLDEWWNPGQS